MKLKIIGVVLALITVAGLAFGVQTNRLPSLGDCFHEIRTPVSPYGPTKFADYTWVDRASPTFELAVADEAAPDLNELLKQGQGVYSAWKELGVLAGMIALVTFLIRLTKLGFIGAAIKRNKLQWIRPLLAMGLAGLTASGAALALEQDFAWVVLAGLVAGLAAPGTHEFLTSLKRAFFPEKRPQNGAA